MNLSDLISDEDVEKRIEVQERIDELKDMLDEYYLESE